MDLEKRNGDEADTGELSLDEQFEQWRKESIPLPSPLAPERSLAEQLQGASRVVALRIFSLFILSVIALMGLSQSFTDFAYFFTASEPLQLGDVRVAYVNDEPLNEMGHNRYVRMESMIPTSVFESPKLRFFFCPLYNVIVQTQQEIPAKQTHKSYFEIEPGEARILNEKLAFVWDMPIRMDIQGRLMSVDSLPNRYQRLWNSFRHEVDFQKDKPVYVLVDGEVPGDFIWFILAYVLAFAIIAFSAWGLRKAIQNERKLREQFNTGI